MKRFLRAVLLLALVAGPAAAADSRREPCDFDSARVWIGTWLDAWTFTSRTILELPDAPAPNFVFFDSTCVYTTFSATAPGAPELEGPGTFGGPLDWRAAPHGDSLVVPNRAALPVALMSFADSDRETGPFFVMAAPSYWRQKGHGEEPGLTAVFLHEFAHTRQIRGITHILGPIDSTWAFERELDDDAVQHRFGSDSTYVKEWLEERDLLFRAAAAESLDEVRALANLALTRMRERHERWFTGKDSVFSVLDDTFLSLEGAGQWVAAAWLSHPKGGGMTRAAAIQKMIGRGRWWTQDEGLGLFLVLERLLPEWPSLVFAEPSMGATPLLERATKAP